MMRMRERRVKAALRRTSILGGASARVQATVARHLHAKNKRLQFQFTFKPVV